MATLVITNGEVLVPALRASGPALNGLDRWQGGVHFVQQAA